MHDIEQAIREHAYRLWMAEGCPDGNAESHWLTAQREILAASLGSLGSVSAATRAPKKPTKKTTSKKARVA